MTDDAAARRASLLVSVGIVVLALAAAIPMLGALDLHLALEGWGPHDYVAQKLDPARYERQFPGGILNYDTSLVMQGNVLLARITGWMPAQTYAWSVLLEHLVFAFGLALFAHAVFGSRLLTVMCVAIALASPLAGVNLARYHGFGLAGGPHGLFYLYAYGTMLGGIGCALRGRLVASAVLLAVTVWAHVLIGAYGVLFTAAALAMRPKLLATRGAMIGACVFVVLALPYVLKIMAESAVSGGGVAADDWIVATRVFSMHWYPVDLGQFGRLAERRFVPLIALGLFALHAMALVGRGKQAGPQHRMVLAGCAACLVATIAGVVISVAVPAPALIKLSLHRTSFMIGLCACLYVAAWLIGEIRSGRLGAAPFAAWALVSMVVATPGLALIPLVIVLMIDVGGGRLSRWTVTGRPQRIALAAGLIVLALLIGFIVLGAVDPKWHRQLWTPLQRLSPWEKKGDLALFGGVGIGGLGWLTLVLATCAAVIALRTRMPHTVRLAVVIALGGMVIVLGRHGREAKWLDGNEAVARAYLEVQQWAETNTDESALFLTDPVRDYGWRDFSLRPNLGSHREWGYSCFLYDTDPAVFDRGMARLAQFDVDVLALGREAIADVETMGAVRRDIRDRVNEAYQALTHEEIQALGVDYAVYPLDKRPENLVLPIAYRNDHFVVFAVTGE